MFQSNVEKVYHVIIIQGIEKYLSFPSFFYQGHVPQSPELVRHCRLSYFDPELMDVFFQIFEVIKAIRVKSVKSNGINLILEILWLLSSHHS